MPSITFNHVKKSFGPVEIIKDFSAEIDDKEFLVLLGPSGCGKSTMLRMIAGLADITDGDILFDDVRVNNQEPKERDIAFVFQSYALYPNMTVEENIAFPLMMPQFRWWHHLPGVAGLMRKRMLRKPELADKVAAVAETLELTDYVHRRPGALSGGQRQRVALARSLVRDPEVYLLDEPLSNLDAKLRNQMRSEITQLHRRVGKTFVYVTHDQVEAMTMATRIIIMRDGVIQQIGTPEEIYDNPANVFVARFIGSPGMNLIPATVEAGEVSIGGHALNVHAYIDAHGEVLMGVRPETIQVGLAGELPVSAQVVSVEQLGGETVLGLVIDDDEVESLKVDGVEISTVLSARISVDRHWREGERCSLAFKPSGLTLFDRTSGSALTTTKQLEGAA